MARFHGIAANALLNKNFPVNRWKKQFPPNVRNPGLCFLVNYFGRKATNLGNVLDSWADRSHLVEAYLGFRSYPLEETKSRCVELQRILRVANACGNTRLIICPILEDVVRPSEWQKYARIVRMIFPKVPLVRSTLNQDFSGGRYEERHGSFPRFSRPIGRCIANPDGTSMTFGDGELYKTKPGHKAQMTPVESARYRKLFNDCFFVCSWSARQQGLHRTSGYNKPPVNKRKYEVTDEAIEWHRRNWF